MADGTTPASGSRIKPPRARLSIDSHRQLLAKRASVIDALVEDPARGKLLFANASLAFKEAGVQLSPGIANHVLHTVRQSADATTRRERLTAELREALGVIPHPSDPAWLAKTLFAKLKLTPLATKGHEPEYLPSIPPEVQERLRTHLPPSTRPRLPARGSRSPARQLPWRLDLDAEIPVLGKARSVPKAVTLPDLWFYLDAHELVRPLLQLGILEVSVMPTLTREQYDAVKAGQRTGGFLDWIDEVSFPEERIRPRKAVAKKATKKTVGKKAVGKKTPTKKTVTRAGAPRASGRTQGE